MSMTPDYGEPWKEKAYNYTVGDTGDIDGVIEIRTREELKVADTWNPSDEKEAFFSRAITCVNACAGMADPAAEIEAMREALREAHDVFVNLSEYWNKDQNENAMADACWHTVETSYDALAKLEPFIPDATPTKP